MLVETAIVTFVVTVGLAILPPTTEVTGDQTWQATTEIARPTETQPFAKLKRGRRYCVT